MKRRLAISFCLLILGSATAAVGADFQRAASLSYGYGEYFDGLDDKGNGQNISFMLARPDVWSARIELGRSYTFGEEAYGIGLSYDRRLPADFNLSIGYGTGTGDLINPEYRWNVALSQYTLWEKRLHWTLGYTRTQSKFSNYSDNVGLAIEYRFAPGFTFYAQTNHDTSYPGKHISRGGGVGLGYSRWKQFELGAGISFGKVSYFITGPGAVLVNYSANGYNLGATRWLGDQYAVNLRLDYGRTSFYKFRGVTLTLLREW